MFNFSIPAVLKAYIDQIVRVGLTVSPNDVGLLTGKQATIILASGGDFRPGSPVEKYNQASGYLRQVLAWIGIEDVEIILADRARAVPVGHGHEIAQPLHHPRHRSQPRPALHHQGPVPRPAPRPAAVILRKRTSQL
jgi:FMN-dependent NADH-azoreductase